MKFSHIFQGWVVSKSTISLTTSKPAKKDIYEEELAQGNVALTRLLLTHAQQELKVVSDLPDEVKASEHVAIRTFDSKKKTVLLIEEANQQALSLSPVSITKKSPKTNLILVLSVLLGSMLGCFVILVRQAIRNYKDKQKT